MRPLTRATRGVIKGNTSKKALVLAVAGVMFFSAATTPTVTPRDTTPTSIASGGGGYPTNYRDYEKERREKREREERQETDFIINFLKTVTDIINDQ